LFGGWSGGCAAGVGSCAVHLDSDLAAIASFQSLGGTWSGTYTNTRIASGCTFNNKGNLTVTLKQTGAVFSESAAVTGLELRLIPSCTITGSTTGTAPEAPVTVAGGTITGTWTVAVQTGGTLAFPFTAKVVGTTMTGTWTCPTCTGSFTLTKP
jgi:hypothetical protein